MLKNYEICTIKMKVTSNGTENSWIHQEQVGPLLIPIVLEKFQISSKFGK